MSRSIFRDNQGFTTLSMTVSLLLSLCLIFTAAQVYRINSSSAAIQDVADAAALSAQTEVAEFMVTANVCDAIALSLSLASSVSLGVGVACLCTPITAPLSQGFIQTGESFIRNKRTFLETAKTGLDSYQKALPFIAAGRAALVAISNNSGQGTCYRAIAMSFPLQGEDIVFPDDGEEAQKVVEDIKQESDHVKDLSSTAESAAQEALEAKERGFLADCGDAQGSYCMRERAASLAGMTGSNNPRYTSVDTWSFSAALNRAQAYYRVRLEHEKPLSDSVADASQSEVRRVFYRYACQELERGFVEETDDSFEAFFPVLPKNMQQFRETGLYKEALFPVTADGDMYTMHGWSGCPCAKGVTHRGSVYELESNEDKFQACDECCFTPQSLGNVAAATSSVQTGFEYHYARVAQAAKDYQKARQELDPLNKQVKDSAQGLLDACGEYAKSALNGRIKANPPGRFGAIAVVFDASSLDMQSWPLAGGMKTLGPRCAISGAALMEDASEDGATVLTGLFDGLSNQAKDALGPLNDAAQLWSRLLETYGAGQEVLGSALEEVLDSIPFASASGLGSWASKALRDVMNQLGLQPAQLKALKPVLVNTSSVSSASDDAIARGYLRLKESALAGAGAVDGVLLWSSQTLQLESQGASIVGDVIEVARFSPFGDEGPLFSVKLPLPTGARNAANEALVALASGIRGFAQEVEGLVRWR